MNTINIGTIPVCKEAVALPLVATATGTWAFMTTFNGAYQYIQFQATQGENIIVPAKLNEDYTYTFKLYQPDNNIFNDSNYCMTTIPMLPEVDYVCPALEVSSENMNIGKIQTVAIEGQLEITNLELLGVKQVAVFVEGTMQREGVDVDEYHLDAVNAKVVFNTELLEGQKITILYFK